MRVLWFITRTSFIVFEDETVLFIMTEFVAISAFAVETVVKGFVSVISLIWRNLTVVSVKSSASRISSFVATEAAWFVWLHNTHCGFWLI